GLTRVRFQGVDVLLGAHTAVAACVHAHHFRSQLGCGPHLPAQTRRQLASPDGQVRVSEVRVATGHHLGDAVGPPAHAIGSRLIDVADTLGKRIADGNVAPKRHRVSLTRPRPYHTSAPLDSPKPSYAPWKGHDSYDCYFPVSIRKEPR